VFPHTSGVGLSVVRDAGGEPEGLRPMMRFAPRVLPDNRRVSFSELHVNKDIWTFDTTSCEAGSTDDAPRVR
jgi:hypothetical protein